MSGDTYMDRPVAAWYEQLAELRTRERFRSERCARSEDLGHYEHDCRYCGQPEDACEC